MTPDDLTQHVADAMTQARINGHWASAPDGENFVCAQAAIAAVLDALPEMVTDKVRKTVWKGIRDYSEEFANPIPDGDDTNNYIRIILTALRGQHEASMRPA